MEVIAYVLAGLIVGIFVILFVLFGFALIRDYEVGILTKKMFGKKLPQGQIIACNKEIGVQADTLMPGLYWRIPFIWKITKARVTEIGPDEIGIIESIEGEPIPKGRLLGDEVDSNSYQDARAFVARKGKKGPQIGVLRPGTYRINTQMFKVTKFKLTNIQEEKIGVVVALDGNPLPPGFIVAPKPREENKERAHKFYQDGQAFIDTGGYRGPQLDTLQPGSYYINPHLFEINTFDVTEIPPGYVGIVRSNVGEDLEKDKTRPKTTEEVKGLDQPVHEDAETATILTSDRNTRGIWREPVAPGKYNLNPLAFTPYLVPTSAVTIDWAKGSEIRTDPDISQTVKKNPAVKPMGESLESEKAREFFKFSQLRVTSKDGFQLDVDVRMIIRISPQNAAFIIARFGSVFNLIEQIVHPLIDSLFRNNAGEQKAIDFVHSRTKLQGQALERARYEFDKYHVEAQNLLIAYIHVDEELLKTQTIKEIALQQQEQYIQEAAAQEQRISVEEKKETANKQKDLVSARISVDINKFRRDAAIAEAEGIGESTKKRADGTAYEKEQVGLGVAKAYQAQKDVLGVESIAFLNAMEKIADGKVRITPDVLVTDNSGGGGLLSAVLANLFMKSGMKFSLKGNTDTEPDKP